MLSVLLEGTLSATPSVRTSTRGTTYTTAQMRVAGEDGETVWCSIIAFHREAAEGLAALSSGDAVAVAGHAVISRWEKDGEHRAGLKVTATRVLTVYQAGQRRKAAADAAGAGRAGSDE